MKGRFKMIIRQWVLALLYPRPLVGLFYLPRYIRHWVSYSKSSEDRISLADMQPCLGDWTTHTPFDAHYFYQGAWLSRQVSQSAPKKHVDVGSSVLTMSVLSAFVETIFVDYRPLRASLPGLVSVAGDVLRLPFEDDSINSLSCLHVIEHIGLGRYGDPIDPQGSIKAAHELERVVAVEGRLYLSLPVGRERVCFNAHRVHAPKTVVAMFQHMKLIDFSYVDDEGALNEHQSLSSANSLEYGCGLFCFEKS